MKGIIIFKTYDLLTETEKLGYVDGYIDAMEAENEAFKPLRIKSEYLYESGFESYLMDDNELWYEEVEETLKNKMYGRQYRVTGILGLWNGQRKAKKDFEGFEAIRGCVGSDANGYEIYQTSRGTLKVDVYHHDGVNHFTIKEKTAKGLRSPHLYD